MQIVIQSGDKSKTEIEMNKMFKDKKRLVATKLTPRRRARERYYIVEASNG